MQVRLLHVQSPIRPLFPVELLVAVDGTTIRVEVEWSMLERLMNGELINAEMVQEFVHRNRDALELAIKAYLYAQGVPLSCHLTMSWEDLRTLHPHSFVAGEPAIAAASTTP